MSLASGGCRPQTPIYQCRFFPISLHKLLTKKHGAFFLKNKYQASILSDSLKCRWLLGAIASTPPYINVSSFQFHYISFQQKQYGAFFLKNKYQASILSDSLKCRWLLGAIAPRPPYTNVSSFQLHYISFKLIIYEAFFLGTYHLIIWKEAWVIFTQRNVS